jgi:phosphatidylethanolamine/phosphatidyl-N-methylethanolamine N-methyltransferase
MSINEYYENDYSKVLESGAVGKVAAIYHKMLEKGHSKNWPLCLEIGAGNAQHFKYVKHGFDKYISSDIRLPVRESIKNSDPRHEFKIIDAEDLSSFESESVDRLIATCVLPHLGDPEKALREWRRVVKKGGVIDVYVPCEPSLLLGLAQLMTTKKKVEKLGWNYERLQYREHRHHYPMLRMLIKEIFEKDIIQQRNFPPGIKFWQLKLFSVYRISLMKREKDLI